VKKNKLLKNISFLLSGLLASAILAACSSDYEYEPPAIPPIVAPSTNAEKLKLYSYLLNEQGIDVVNLGETRTIVIASDRLFIPDSANLNKDYARYLKIIAQLINKYDTTSISVAAYTNQSGEVARALTEKQAQKVMEFLKKEGVDTRLLYAKGYGNSHPVAVSGSNNQLNNRIEIKFQFHKEGQRE
jgi:outer membrane protein OmpA-like peptidoglycan-associated protein